MDKRFKHPWFQVLADIKKKAADAGLTEKEIVELPQMIIGEINKEIKPRGTSKKRTFQPRGRLPKGFWRTISAESCLKHLAGI